MSSPSHTPEKPGVGLEEALEAYLGSPEHERSWQAAVERDASLTNEEIAEEIAELARAGHGIGATVLGLLNRIRPNSSADALEASARRIAARKCGISDPSGARLPDDIWRQALPDARAALADEDDGQRIIDGLDDAIAWAQGDESCAQLVTVVPVEPPDDRIKAAVDFALRVSLGGSYHWPDYMRDLYRIMLRYPPPVEGVEQAAPDGVIFGDAAAVLSRPSYSVAPGLERADLVKRLAALVRELADAKAEIGRMGETLTAAEACMSIVEPRSDKAEYLRILAMVRAALTSGASHADPR